MKRCLLAALLLGACTDQAIIDAAYPDREKFAFASKDGESVFTYTCASGSDTRGRAAKAHAYLDTRFQAAVDGAADKLIAAPDARATRAVTRALDTEIEDIVEQTEAQYSCLFIQSRDV